MIYLGGFSRETREAWVTIGHAQGWLIEEEDEMPLWMEFEYAAGLFFRLRFTADAPEHFPAGKNLTLVTLKSLLDAYLVEEQTARAGSAAAGRRY
jgi:hypothetical protein